MIARVVSVSCVELLVKPLVEKIESYRLSRSEFETIRLIGSGAFGEVSLVKSKSSNEYFALKSLHKYDMLKRSDEEREVLVKAINSLHELGYVHRDIKPDNVLLETSGHIVLTDFGSCLRIGNDGLIRNTAAVGTPDYIAPEILRAAEDTHGTFGVECDYWSLGVVMYEMLFGETPFYSENLIQTYSQIMNFEKTFKFPEDDEGVSDAAKDLLKHFICDRKQRYGRNGIEEIIKHPFFTGIDWENIRSQAAPYQPEVKSPEDTSNFDIEESARTHEGPPLGSVFRGCQVACIGFTFTKDSPLNQIGKLGENLKTELLEGGATAIAATADMPCPKCQGLESRVHDLESELQTLITDMQQQPAPSSPKQNGTSSAAALEAAMEKLATSEARSKELAAEAQRLRTVLDAAEARCVSEEKHNVYLRKALAEEQERVERLKFDVREYEEENEDLCKRIQETSSKLRDKEAACERLLNDLDEKRAELAAQRKLLDEYIQQQHQQSLKPAAAAALENNHSNGFAAIAGDTTAAVTMAKTELELKFREAVAWAEECEAKLANQEAYWTDQKLRWQRERSELQDRIREIVLERTSFLEGELRQERQRYTALEQRVMVWENQLVDLISMADNEWAANDSLHDTVLHLMSDLQRIRNGSPEGSEYDDHRPVSGITSIALNSGGLGNAADWRQRKAGRISKMERSNLQLALNNEIRERELAQQRVRELEVQLEETTARLTDTSNKLLQTEKEKETLRDQLVKVTNEVRRSRMKTAEMDESVCLRAELLNGVHTSGHRTAESTTMQQASRSSEKSISVGSGSGSGVSMNSHKLVPESFANPIKCLVCASLLLGQHWQGLRCQQCGFACHLQCRQAAASLPCSSGTVPSGMPSFDTDVAFGLGTILEGPVRTPKGDIKRGWVQQYAFLCDTRLFIYDCTAVRRARTVYQPGKETSRDPRASTLATDGGVGSTAVPPKSTGTLSITLPYNGGTQITYETVYDIHGNSPTCVIDLSASGFEVSHVSNTDVIHAKRSEVPHILKVNPDDYAGSTLVYLLFDTREECERWFGALEDGARLVTRNFARTLDSQCLQLSLLSDASFPLIKHILSACVFDEHRILMGTEDGLYIVDLRYKTYARVGEKKPIYQVEALPEELQLVVVIQDKQRRLRLVLSGAIEGMNYEKIRVADPKSGVNLLAHGWSRGRTAYLLCAASSSIGGVWAYEVVREASRHRRLLELTPPPSSSQIQALCLVRDGDCLAVGFESSFVIYNIWCHGAINVLLEPSCIDLDPSLLMFRQGRFAAQLAISVTFDEFLLVFENCGIYVDSQGQLTRQVYLFWPAKPLTRGFAYRQPLLYVFTEAGLFLFNVETSTWSASAAGLRRLRPLNSFDGHLCLMTHSSIQGLSKLVSSGSSSSANGGSSSGNAGGSGSGGFSGTANSSLVYLPPPRKSMFASVQRRRTNTSLLSSPLIRPLGVSGGVERQLDLNNVALLDANARARKSRRFSIFSRGPLFGPLLDSVTSDHGTTLANSGGSSCGPAASGTTTATTTTTTTTSGSRLISAPSDFQHLAHQGPDVRIHFIDLAQSQRATHCSTGNFSLAVESSVGTKQSRMHSDSRASLNSSSSRQSTDQSLGEPEGAAESIPLSLPLSTSAPDGASAGDMEEEAITPSASSNTSSSHHHHHHVPPTSSPRSTHRPTPPLDSPCFRDKVLALFHTLDSDMLPNLNNPATPTEEVPTST
ncbi:Serine/threonine-protein kinase MRCK beta [Taenia crassiceps]|uniref:non-specific serine/threonine protein kinase n=1 Tax=Taenia crassiceps TaxID=6207 RepID=A0ABR4QI32_9CEST